MQSYLGAGGGGRGQASLGGEQVSCDLNDRLGSGRSSRQRERLVPSSLGTGLGWFREEQECEGAWGQDEVRGQGSRPPGGGRQAGRGLAITVPAGAMPPWTEEGAEAHCTPTRGRSHFRLCGPCGHGAQVAL